jgi:hypothetical protein
MCAAASAATAGCKPGPENEPASNTPAAIADTTPKERRRLKAFEGMIGPLKTDGITASIVATVDAQIRLNLSVYPCQGKSFRRQGRSGTAENVCSPNWL